MSIANDVEENIDSSFSAHIPVSAVVFVVGYADFDVAPDVGPGYFDNGIVDIGLADSDTANCDNYFGTKSVGSVLESMTAVFYDSGYCEARTVASETIDQTDTEAIDQTGAETIDQTGAATIDQTGAETIDQIGTARKIVVGYDLDIVGYNQNSDFAADKSGQNFQGSHGTQYLPENFDVAGFVVADSAKLAAEPETAAGAESVAGLAVQLAAGLVVASAVVFAVMLVVGSAAGFAVQTAAELAVASAGQLFLQLTAFAASRVAHLHS